MGRALKFTMTLKTLFHNKLISKYKWKLRNWWIYKFLPCWPLVWKKNAIRKQQNALDLLRLRHAEEMKETIEKVDGILRRASKVWIERPRDMGKRFRAFVEIDEQTIAQFMIHGDRNIAYFIGERIGRHATDALLAINSIRDPEFEERKRYGQIT